MKTTLEMLDQTHKAAQEHYKEVYGANTRVELCNFSDGALGYIVITNAQNIRKKEERFQSIRVRMAKQKAH